ncbi:MAG: hypothetical protein JXQ71_10770 [Verrucomicrobia bacterium]|nr:hypothetical protein [Verrucomicrobiota bacterium]
MVTALGPDPDGSGLLLRLWELAGDHGPCKVRLPPRLDVATAQPVDLRGKPQGHAIPVSKGAFRFECAAFAPASFRLQP